VVIVSPTTRVETLPQPAPHALAEELAALDAGWDELLA